MTDPSKVTQADIQFNEKYKEYLDILTKPEKGLVDEYFQTITEEVKTGINQKTGKPLTDLEKAQRWSTIASAIAALATGAYYGGKGFTGKGTNAPKTPTLKGNKGGKNYTLDRGKNKGKTGYKKPSGSDKLLKPNLLDDLLKSGVKYNPDDVVMVTKNTEKDLLWLEYGNNKAGLNHIEIRHATDFFKRGIKNIPEFIYDMLKNKPISIVESSKGMNATYIVNGKKYLIAYGKNGFIVSVYPI
ncbi:hypothetical protein [Enterococcus plantarum]|uniref:hypothetical protein n=1 Tax=Enterococcus plantarum TaxID=1077675 RepID=UPI0011B81F6B|nr:hypothetical protein [Enterococcus plantarum]